MRGSIGASSTIHTFKGANDAFNSRKSETLEYRPNEMWLIYGPVKTLPCGLEDKGSRSNLTDPPPSPQGRVPPK
jgi:hypothetical protein